MITTRQDIQLTSEAKISSKSKKWKKHINHRYIKDTMECTWISQVENLERRQAQNLHKYAKRKNRKLE